MYGLTHVRSKRVFRADHASRIPIPTVTPCSRSSTSAVSFDSGGPASLGALLEREIRDADLTTHILRSLQVMGYDLRGFRITPTPASSVARLQYVHLSGKKVAY